MKKLFSLFAFCAMFVALTSVSNAQSGGIPHNPTAGISEKDPCPPCPPKAVRPTPLRKTMPAKDCGDVIVNVHCPHEVPNHGPWNPPNGETAIAYPVYESSDEMLSRGGLLLWLLLLTVVLVFIAGTLWNGRNSNVSPPRTINHYGSHYHNHRPAPTPTPAPPAVNPGPANKEHSMD